MGSLPRSVNWRKSVVIKVEKGISVMPDKISVLWKASGTVEFHSGFMWQTGRSSCKEQENVDL